MRNAWCRLRRHNVRDLGYPCRQHRVWCYDCARDLLSWHGYDPLVPVDMRKKADRVAP